MSLVNDVLRQLDSAVSKPQKSLPLHPMAADEPVRKKQIARIVFYIVVALLLSILLLQTFYKESIVDIFTGNKSAEIKQVEAVITQEKERLEKTRLEQEVLKPESLQSKPLQSEPLKTDTPVVSSIKNKTEITVSQLESKKLKDKVPVVEKPLDNKPKKPEQPKNKVQEKTQAQAPKKIQAQEFQPAKIKTVENLGFKEYQLALRSYKNKQNKSALAWIDAAIAAEKKDEYLRLKVRILTQQGNAEVLREFVLNNNDHTSLAWFQLVAPTLQMFSYYELSNAYYSELVRQQPNEVKWQLATALNFSKLGLNEKTYSIYKNLLDSNLLTNKQKQWIASRLERMEQGRGVKNES